MMNLKIRSALDADCFSGGLLLNLGACHCSFGLPGELGDHRLALLLGQVFHQRFVGLLQIGILVDLLQDPFLHPLLPVEFAHLVQDERAFEPFARHPLDVCPIFGVLFYVGVDLCIDFGILSIGGSVGRGGIAAGAWLRGSFRSVHNGLMFLFLLHDTLS